MNPTAPESVPELEQRVATRQRAAALAKLALLVGLFVAGVAAIRLTPLGDWLSEESLAAFVGQFGLFAGPVFTLIFGVLLALWVPGTVLTLAASALFGTWAIPVVYGGSLLGGMLGYQLGARLGEDTLEHLFGPRLAAGGPYRALLQKHGFSSVLYLRMIPTPFNLISYVAGLSPISFRQYTLATAIGIAPSCVAFTHLMATALRVIQADDWGALVEPRTLGAIAIYAVALSIPFWIRVGRRRFGWFERVGEIDG